MFHRLARYSRPLAVRSCRNFGNYRRNVPVIRMMSPFRQRGFFDDFFTSPFSRRLQEMEREMMEDFANMMNTTGRSSSRSGFQVSCNNKMYELKLDVQDYKAEDLEIKLSGNTLKVTGKHEHTHDNHGTLKREFVHEFQLPENVITDSLESALSEEGVLRIRADVKAEEKQPDKVLEIKRDSSSKTNSEKKDNSDKTS